MRRAVEIISRILFRYIYEKKLNINTHILKCKIINFNSIPHISREMLLAWTDLDLSRDPESVQQILHEPLHGNVNIPQKQKHENKQADRISIKLSKRLMGLQDKRL